MQYKQIIGKKYVISLYNIFLNFSLKIRRNRNKSDRIYIEGKEDKRSGRI